MKTELVQDKVSVFRGRGGFTLRIGEEGSLLYLQERLRERFGVGTRVFSDQAACYPFVRGVSGSQYLLKVIVDGEQGVINLNTDPDLHGDLFYVLKLNSVRSGWLKMLVEEVKVNTNPGPPKRIDKNDYISRFF